MSNTIAPIIKLMQINFCKDDDMFQVLAGGKDVKKEGFEESLDFCVDMLIEANRKNIPPNPVLAPEGDMIIRIKKIAGSYEVRTARFILEFEILKDALHYIMVNYGQICDTSRPDSLIDYGFDDGLVDLASSDLSNVFQFSSPNQSEVF